VSYTIEVTNASNSSWAGGVIGTNNSAYANGVFYFIACGNTLSGVDMDFSVTIAQATLTTGTITGSQFCAGAAVSVPYSTNAAFSPNTFTAQLSDASGSFTSAVNIGSISSTNLSGTISATIPSGTAAGTQYRIRVVSSNPALTGSDNGVDLTVNAAPQGILTGSSATYCNGTTATALSVSASAGSGTITGYTWYSNASNSNSGGTLVATHPSSSATDTYTPLTTSPGTLYYYAVVTNSNTCSAPSNVSGAITVNPIPTANASPSSQVICSGLGMTTVNITGTGSSFSWTRDNTGTVTGMPTTGTGSSISGTLTNTTNAPVTVNFTITPQIPGGGGTSQLINETWNTVSPLPSGWAAQNLSSPAGVTDWFQGNTVVFSGNTGSGYIGANYNNSGASGTISNWLFTPNLALRNGDVLTFYTRTANTVFPDRLQVRMSTNGVSVNAGSTSTSVGDFTTLLLDINPTLTTTGYPVAWTQYTITMSGLPTGGISGRLAFRYFVTNAGPGAPNSDYIGIDDVVYSSTSGCTGPTTTASITVNPKPVVSASPSSQDLACSGQAIGSIGLSSNVAGTTFSWTRDHISDVTGIASIGSSNPIMGSLTNTSGSATPVIFTITPTYTNGGVGCPGNTTTATVNVPSTLAASASVTNALNNTAYPMAGQELQTIYLNYPGSAQSQTINVTAAGGTGAYSYSWEKSNCLAYNMGVPSYNTLTSGSPAVPVTANTYTWSPTTADTCSFFGDNVYAFKVTVSDINGCTATTTKKLNVVNPWVGAAGTSNVQICHKVPRSTLTQILQVAPSLVASHLGHGDILGNCPVFIGKQILPGEEDGEEMHTAFIYPNPTTGVFMLELNEITSENADITVTDISGKVIQNKTMAKDGPKTATFDMNNYAKGVYLIQVIDGAFVFRDKIIVQ
jgi:hypothetical protein